MLFHISKIFGFLLKPTGFLILILIINFITRNSTLRKRLSFVILILFYLFSCPFFVNILVNAWEVAPKDINKMKFNEVGVVLTGGIMDDYHGVYLGDQGDRIYQTLRLYKKNKINKIIISGGELFGMKKRASQNDLSKLFLIENGVDSLDIIQESKSRNTFENAKYSAQIIKSQFPKSKILIISSALHLKRAKACFAKQKIYGDVFPVHILESKISFNLLKFIPSAGSYYDLEQVVNEISGTIVYKLLGYI